MSDKLSLLRMIDELQKRGVKSFSGLIDGEQVALEFGPLTEPVPASAPFVDPEQCRCGHAGFQHQSGLCILGCDPEKCIEPDKVQ